MTTITTGDPQAGHAVLADAFHAEGVRAVFCLMGIANMRWIASLSRHPDIGVTHVRHENAAIAMADAYAQATGDVGVASVTCGPGVTQIPTSRTESSRRRTPIVVFAGDTSVSGGYDLHQFDQGPLVTATGAAFVPVRSVDRLLADTHRAFLTARRERRPVVLSVPTDIQETPVHGGKYIPSWEALVSPAPYHPNPSQVRSAVDAIVSAKRPVVIAGRGAVISDAYAELVDLGDRIGALLMTTLLAKDWFDAEPYSLGLTGGFADPSTRALLAHADLVIAVGTCLDHYATGGGRLFGGAHVMQIDTDPLVWGRSDVRVENFVVGDAASAVRDLIAELDSRGVGRRSGYRTPDVAVLIDARRTTDDPVPLEDGTLDPRAVLRALDEAVPRDWTIVVGAGHFWTMAVDYFHERTPSDYRFTCLDFGVVGQGLPSAIGVAVADPSRSVLLVEGDGSLLMNIQELETAARHQIGNLVVCAINDGAFGAEAHKLRAWGLDENLAVFGRPDFAAIAEAFGLNGVHLADPADIGTILERHASGCSTTVIDAWTSRTVLSASYRRFYFGEPDAR